MNHDRRRVSVFSGLLLGVGLIFVIVPYLWILLTAFKRPVDAAAVPPKIFSPISFRAWEELLSGPFPASLLNSVIITVGTTVATLIIGVPAGYAFARGRFVGRWFLGGWLLFSRMMPPVIFIIPLFLFFHQLRLINTYLGLILAYMSGLLPFTVWMCAGYFEDIPQEIEEAARVDGASRMRAFITVVLPMALPGVLTVGVLIAIASWSEYFIPFLLAGTGTNPATVGLVNYVGSNTIDWGAMAAASLTLVLPVVVLTLFAQRGMLRGLSAGAVKG
ncbi:MAG: carbohydrate ABC transporter permease [Chloroflexi bacterium]|nr:carbohydrate ABC transporter permease [Chloroflexota bacterium]